MKTLFRISNINEWCDNTKGHAFLQMPQVASSKKHQYFNWIH
jgi:hypothetical protein